MQFHFRLLRYNYFSTATGRREETSDGRGDPSSLGACSGVTSCLVTSLGVWMCSCCTCALYLRLLRELEGVYAIGEVGCERVVQLAQRLLQRLERLFVLLQCLQLLLEADLPVHRLEVEKVRSLSFFLLL